MSDLLRIRLLFLRPCLPVHHLHSLPIPSLLLASPSSILLVRLPLFSSSIWSPPHPYQSYDCVFFIIRILVILVLSPLLSHRFRLLPPYGHRYDISRVHPVILVPF